MNTQTYAQDNGSEPFDWNRFLNYPQSGISWKNAEHLASSWITCACGNQCSAIDRHDNGSPEDDKLRQYGAQFYRCILFRQKAAAREVLKQIERRSAYLIRKIKAAK